MTDIVDQATRSRMMAGIKGKNTRPEMLVRQGLHRRGVRFRLHVAALPGHPDLCFKRYHAVVFVHGCYWHRHENCRFATTPTSRKDFWLSKFAANVERDKRALSGLRQMGWRVGVVWECSLRPSGLEQTMLAITDWLTSDRPFIEIGKEDLCDH